MSRDPREPLDPLLVGVVRTLGRRGDYSDAELVAMHGTVAQPLVDGLRVVIAAEVARQLDERATS